MPLFIGMSKNTKNQPTMTDLLRAALNEAKSLRAVERATGVKNQSLSKFLNGEQSLRLDMADKLAAYFQIVSHRTHQSEGLRDDWQSG